MEIEKEKYKKCKRIELSTFYKKFWLYLENQGLKRRDLEIKAPEYYECLNHFREIYDSEGSKISKLFTKFGYPFIILYDEFLQSIHLGKNYKKKDANEKLKKYFINKNLGKIIMFRCYYWKSFDEYKTDIC